MNLHCLDGDDIYDAVSGEEESDPDMISGRPDFPPSLKFNNERKIVLQIFC